MNTKRSTDLDSCSGSSPKTAAPKEAPAMPAAPTGAPQAPQAESAVPLAAAAVVMAAPAPAPAAEEEKTPPEAVHEVTSAAAALSVSDETPASAPVALFGSQLMAASPSQRSSLRPLATAAISARTTSPSPCPQTTRIVSCLADPPTDRQRARLTHFHDR